MIFADVAGDYLLYIRHERRLSTNTFYCYKCHLQQFVDWLTGQGYQEPTLAAVFTAAILRRYLYSLSEKGLRPRTIRSNFHEIRGLGLFCAENGILKESPAHTIHRDGIAAFKVPQPKVAPAKPPYTGKPRGRRKKVVVDAEAQDA